jgi:cysteinyl-tRNA synthetase
LFTLARAVNRFAAHKKAQKRGGPLVAPALEAFALVRDAFGLMAMDTRAFHEEVKHKRLAALGIARADIDAMIADRSAARGTKDWARADSIRDALVEKGIEVLDLSDGVEWRVRLGADS